MIVLKILVLAAALLSSYGVALNTFFLVRQMLAGKKGTTSAWPFIICSLSWATFLCL